MRPFVALLACGACSCTGDNLRFQPPPPACTGSAPSCIGQRPVDCVAADGGTVLRAQPCPSAATCADGRCVPPDGATTCAREEECGPDGSCTALVDPASGTLRTFCVGAEGTLVGPAACERASECRSNLCLPTAKGGSSLCYLACQSSRDCPPLYVCRTFNITITGIRGTISGCGPP
jgi:hypothetical protein